ncbi:MAG TPA: DVU3141 family protein [Dongiaceae bacterium]
MNTHIFKRPSRLAMTTVARSAVLSGALLLPVLLCAGSAEASGLANPFPATAENLSPDEITQISAAFEQALSEAKPGTVVVWKSTESGRSGQVKVLRGWEAQAGHCVELEQRFGKGDKAIYQVPFCQGQDGGWKMTF